jgi:hypothetical protein
LPKREPVDERIMPAFNLQSAVGRNFEIPLLPITSIPATMELAMPGAIDDFVG